MSRRETDEDDRAGSSLPPQPHQLLDHEKRFTPYYTTHEAAKGFPGHATAYLSSSLKYPPEQYPQPRNFYPASDPIVECRKESEEQPGERSSDQVQALKDVEDMSEDERHARDEQEFSSSPPESLVQSQKKRWTELLTELLGEEKNMEDPLKRRARAELRRLKRLADLAGGKG